MARGVEVCFSFGALELHVTSRNQAARRLKICSNLHFVVQDGPIEAFYASFMPDFQRSHTLEATGKSTVCFWGNQEGFLIICRFLRIFGG